MFDPSKLQEMMQQAQQMQDQAQAQLKARTVEGTAGGGRVRITLNGLSEVRGVHIDPSVVDAKDVAMLEDLVRAALGVALARIEDLRAEQARQMAGAMGMPSF
jgi:hypothetical protein